MLTRPVFKYVDVNHKEAVAAGSVKFGTAATYGDLETSRADPLDSGVEVFQTRDLINSTAEDIRTIKRMGFGVQNGSVFGVSILGMRPRRVWGPPRFVMCFSRRADNLALCRERPQAVFQIDYPRTYARTLRKALPRLGGIDLGPILYAPRRIAAEGHDPIEPSPFTKDPAFAHEEEWRIAWHPAGNGPIEGFISTVPAIVPLIRFVGILGQDKRNAVSGASL